MPEVIDLDRALARPFVKEFRDWVVGNVDFWSECDADSVLENTIAAAIAMARDHGRRAGFAACRAINQIKSETD